MKLTREMLDVKPKEEGQNCDTCPFMQNGVQTCRLSGLNHDLEVGIDEEFKCYPVPVCYSHSIQLKPEYSPLLDV